MAEKLPWRFVVVDDNRKYAEQVHKHYDGVAVAGRKIHVRIANTFDEARDLLRGRKTDLLILDVFEGKPEEDVETGVELVKELRKTGFAPVILYTAKKELVNAHQTAFVRIVGKGAKGPDELDAEVNQFFDQGIVQLTRAAADAVDAAMSDYMWQFVESNWNDIRKLPDTGDAARLVAQRLAYWFQSSAPDSMAADMTGKAAAAGALAHPTTAYVKPPMGNDLRLGDVVRASNGAYWVIVQPTCDMVCRPPHNKPNKHTIIMAKADRLQDMEGFKTWANGDAAHELSGQMKSMIANKAGENFHFLPGAWDVPPLVADFQSLLTPAFDDVKAKKGWDILATLTPPHAEHLGSRFARYVGRIGVPDIDHSGLIALAAQTRTKGPAPKPPAKK